MNPGKTTRTRLRRFAASNTMIVLALLVTLLLPLHGILNAAASIQSPAHYHSHSQRDVDASHALHLRSEVTNRTNRRDRSIGAHDLEHASSTTHHEYPDKRTATLDHDDDTLGHDGVHDTFSTHDDDGDDHHDAHQGRPRASVGHHAHAFDASNVVYLDGESESPERAATGKTATLNTDTVLPGWWMVFPPNMGAQVLPEPGCDFDSHISSPHRRPPSAAFRHA